MPVNEKQKSGKTQLVAPSLAEQLQHAKQELFEICQGLPDELVSTLIVPNTHNEECVVHKFVVPSGNFITINPKDSKQNAYFEPRDANKLIVEGNVIIYASSALGGRRTKIAEYTVTCTEDCTCNWSTAYFFAPGDQIETTFTSKSGVIDAVNSRIDHRVSVIELDTIVQHNATKEGYGIVPGRPAKEISSEIRTNIKGTESMIYKFYCPAGYAVLIVKRKGYGLQFIPRDKKGEIITGTVTVFVKSRLTGRTTQVLVHRAAHPDDWTHDVIETNDELAVGPGKCIVVMFESDKVLFPNKTFLAIRAEICRVTP